MKTKEETLEFIGTQLDWKEKDPSYRLQDGKKWYEFENNILGKRETGMWHYGRCELKELMEFLYDETSL